MRLKTTCDFCNGEMKLVEWLHCGDRYRATFKCHKCGARTVLATRDETDNISCPECLWVGHVDLSGDRLYVTCPECHHDIRL